MNESEAKAIVINRIESSSFENFDVDSNGQVVIYTGVYLRSDGSYGNEPDNKKEDKPNYVYDPYFPNVSLSAEGVISFFESWGLFCNDFCSIDYKHFPDMLVAAENIAGMHFANFVNYAVQVDSSGEKIYLSFYTEQSLINFWADMKDDSYILD